MFENIQVGIDLAGSLLSKRDRYFPLQNALLELIDNSVDEGATVISIKENEGDLTIEDNGGGFTCIESALIIGKSVKDKKIGRFGVGLKDACLRYSNATVIESNGVSVCVPWKLMIDGLDNGIITPTEIKNEPVTRIILQDFRTRYRQAIETKDIRRTYQPLIESGQININVTGTELQSLPLPSFTETIHESITFDGKRLLLVGGIYPTNDPARSEWRGYNPYYNGRLIGNGKITSSGTGDEGCTSFCFMLHLNDDLEPWSLATNKDEVAELDELLDYIYHTYTRPILERGAAQAMDIEMKEIEERVNTVLNVSGNITRGPRQESAIKKPESKPGSPKRNTKTATSTGGYATITGKRRERIRFMFQHLGGDAMGEVQADKAGLIITANLDNAFVANFKQNPDMAVFFAKMTHAIYRKSSRLDCAPEEFTAGIMHSAGEELAYSATTNTK